MAMPREQEEAARDPSADQRTSNELVRLIRKLRWIGMDEEAQPLVEELVRRGTASAVTVITPSRETD